MAERLVYSPKAYVYIKNIREEIMDLSEYVIAGEVSRLVDQVSTAKITLRNPDRIFTRPPEVAFHPMDPITIFLERTPGHPVQVFTGFLNKTPYYQMRPGPITLEASCTLKISSTPGSSLHSPTRSACSNTTGGSRPLARKARKSSGRSGAKASRDSKQAKAEELANKWIEKAGTERVPEKHQRSALRQRRRRTSMPPTTAPSPHCCGPSSSSSVTGAMRRFGSRTSRRLCPSSSTSCGTTSNRTTKPHRLRSRRSGQQPLVRDRKVRAEDPLAGKAKQPPAATSSRRRKSRKR